MFDLIFDGRLLPGADARQARLRLTAFFRLTDPADVEPFFRGGDVTLRRALPRAEAQALCEKLVSGGLACHIARHTVAEPEPDPQPHTEPEPQPEPKPQPDPEPATGGAEPRTALAAAPPNLFQIRSDLPQRLAPDADAAQLRFLATALATGAAGLVLVAAILARLFWWSPAEPVTGSESILSATDGTLYMLAGNRVLVHNRSGNHTATLGAADLGLRAIDKLLDAGDGALVLSGVKSGEDPSAQRPWRCTLDAANGSGTCMALTTGPLDVTSLAASRLTDTLFAVTAARQLVRVSGGEVREHVMLPDGDRSPRLINHRGLLIMNTGDGPGLGVYRPDVGAFGQQLDEILLLHPEAIAREQTRVADFAITAQAGWALLASDSATDLYAFDGTWAPVQAVELPDGFRPQYLAAWRDRLLAYTPDAVQVQRIRSDGRVEAPLLSDSLDALAARTRTLAARGQLMTALVLLALGVTLAVGAVLTWMNWHLRALPEDPGAEPAFLLEHRLQQLHWVPPDPARRAAGARWALASVTAVGLLLLLAFTGQTALAYLALPILFLSVAALRYLHTPAPQIGLARGDLALVDHRGVYQTGATESFYRWGPFILRGGVLGCTGLPGLPGTQCRACAGRDDSPDAIDTVDIGTHCHPARVLHLLLESRHPLIALALSIPAGLVIATCIAMAGP